MTTLATPVPVLDESAHEFLTRFVSHVGTVVGYGDERIVTIARVRTLLLAALAHGGDDASEPWRPLYRIVAEILGADPVPGAQIARAYLQSFIHENGDLAHD